MTFRNHLYFGKFGKGGPFLHSWEAASDSFDSALRRRQSLGLSIGGAPDAEAIFLVFFQKYTFLSMFGLNFCLKRVFK